MRNHFKIFTPFVVLLAVITSCESQPQYSVTIENIPECINKVGLYAYDSVYSAVRELGNVPVNHSGKRIRFSGNLNNITIAYIQVWEDSITNKYYFVLDSTVTILGFPVSGNVMRYLSGSINNMSIENLDIRVHNLAYKHNAQLNDYNLTVNDTLISPAELEHKLQAIDYIRNEIMNSINSYEAQQYLSNNRTADSSNVSISPYEWLVRHRYQTLLSESEQ